MNTTKPPERSSNLAPDITCERVREDTARATRWVDDIDPFDRIDPPYSLEIRYANPYDDEDLLDWFDRDLVTKINARTVRVESDNIANLPF